MTRTSTLVALVAILLLLALPATVAAQPFSPDIQRIGTSDGADIDAASPLPVTGTVTLTAETGAGATTADTLRTVTSTDSPDVISLGTLDNVVGATSAATPTSAALIGAVDSVSGNLMPLRVFDADTGAGNDFRLGTVPLLAGAGGGTPASAGAGAVDAGTQRTTLAADDPAVVSLGLLDDAIYAPGAATSKGLLAIGSDWTTGNAHELDMTFGSAHVDLRYLNGIAVVTGAANNNTGVLTVTESSRASSSEPSCSTATAGDAGDAHVIAARAGRRLIWVQIQGDADGQLRVARAATTGATCTTTTGVGTLLDAGTATTAGGYWEDVVGYSGPVAVCVPTAAATVSYCWGEVY